MSEDIELTNFVRARLEEGLSPEPPRMGEIMRAAKAASFALAARQKSRRRLRGPALAAASVALVCSFAAFFARSPTERIRHLPMRRPCPKCSLPGRTRRMKPPSQALPMLRNDGSGHIKPESSSIPRDILV